ncbi:hypothetical protein BC829DRAFT_445518, partial [Chytridium lagenaria]
SKDTSSSPDPAINKNAIYVALASSALVFVLMIAAFFVGMDVRSESERQTKVTMIYKMTFKLGEGAAVAIGAGVLSGIVGGFYAYVIYQLGVGKNVNEESKA